MFCKINIFSILKKCMREHATCADGDDELRYPHKSVAMDQLICANHHHVKTSAFFVSNLRLQSDRAFIQHYTWNTPVLNCGTSGLLLAASMPSEISFR